MLIIFLHGGAQALEQLALESANDAVLKARWNYGLLYEDSSVSAGARGAHNPDFSIKALTGAIAAVQAVSPEETSGSASGRECGAAYHCV